MKNELSKQDSLKNSGVLILNESSFIPREKTVVVLGVARGGTTMVASVLEALGVPMGEKLGPVREDVALSNAVEMRDIKRFKEIVAQRNAEHLIWGWKRPSAIEHSDVWKTGFRNPYIIAVFRDPFAIANRNRISMLSDIFQNMGRSVQHLDELVKFLGQQQCPVLLCSYEKVLASPETFVQEVDKFLALNSPERWNDAVLTINPASKEYLESSRITNSLGCLDKVNAQFCSGWAFYPKQPARRGNVQIFLNDQFVHSVLAQRPRPDLKESGSHPTGLCGFRFEWPEGLEIKSGDRVSAQLEGDNKLLKGAPRTIESASNVQVKSDSSTPVNRVVTGALPAFYGIGAQKAGSTWIYEMLKAHPQLHLPKQKEVHYWDVHYKRPLRWYRKHFMPDRINGDITPAYAILPEAKVAEIHQLTPDAKILFSMRHPIDRAWSFVQMEIKREFDKCPEDLLAGVPQGASLDFVRHKLFLPGCLARNDYAMTIRRWRKFFGADAFMHFRFERIAENPRQLLVDACRHIGADTAWAEGLNEVVIAQKVFSFEKIPFPPALRAEYVERCSPFVDDLEQLLGESFDSWRN